MSAEKKYSESEVDGLAAFMGGLTSALTAYDYHLATFAGAVVRCVVVTLVLGLGLWFSRWLRRFIGPVKITVSREKP